MSRYFEKTERTYHVKRVSDVDRNALDQATYEQIINWFRKATDLYPIKTPMTESMLMNIAYSVSYYMWGDTGEHNSTKIITESLLSYKNHKSQFDRRWMNEECFSDIEGDFQIMQYMERLDYKKAFPLNSSILKIFIFSIANTIKRPIIVLSSNHKLQAIYLPLVTNPATNVLYPIVLYENSERFYPLLMDKHFEKIPIIPLFSSDLKNLHVAFLLPEEKNKDSIQRLLQSYMISGSSKKHDNSNHYFAQLLPLSKSGKSKSSKPKDDVVYQAKLCTTPGCDLFGTKENNWKCSKCIESEIIKTLNDEYRTKPTDQHRITLEDEEYNFELEPEPTAPDFELLTLKLSESKLEEEEKPSMTNVLCKFPQCPNFTSRYTAPYCYDHVNYGNPINEMQNVAEAVNISSKFDEIMKESEDRPKATAVMCLGALRGCKNFGNSKCSGYCNECFTSLSK